MYTSQLNYRLIYLFRWKFSTIGRIWNHLWININVKSAVHRDTCHFVLFLCNISRSFARSSHSHFYSALVKPILEYGSFVWSLCYKSRVNDIERIWHKFIRLVVRYSGCPIPIDSHNYENSYENTNLRTLHNRRKVLDIMFVSTVIVNCI